MALFYTTETPKADTALMLNAAKLQASAGQQLGAGLGAGAKGYLDSTQQALANKRAEEQLGFQRASAQREADKATQDKLLGEALAQAQQNRTVGGFRTDIVTQGNEAEVKQAEANLLKQQQMNTRRLAQQEEGSNKYSELFAKYSREKVEGAENIQGTQYQRNKNNDFIGADSVIGRLLGKPQPTEQKYTPEQAHTKALLESGLAGIRGTVTEQSVPELVKTVTKQTPITRDMTEKEQLEYGINQVMNHPTLGGEAKLKAKAALEKKYKEATFDQQLRVLTAQKEEAAADSVGKQILQDLGKPVPKGMSGKALERYATQAAKKKPKPDDSGSKLLTKAIQGVRTDAGIFNFNDEREDAQSAVKLAKDEQKSDKEIANAITVATDEDREFSLEKFKRALGLK